MESSLETLIAHIWKDDSFTFADPLINQAEYQNKVSSLLSKIFFISVTKVELLQLDLNSSSAVLEREVLKLRQGTFQLEILFLEIKELLGRRHN